MRGSAKTLLLALGFFLSVSAPALAGFKGEVDLETGYASNTRDSLDAALGQRARWDQSLTTRLMWSDTFASGWSLDAAYLAVARYGRGVELMRRERASVPFFPVDPDETSLWHLNRVLVDRERTYAEHRFDRLAVGYSGSNLVVRAGRQALTWGGGLVFHPMDLFNPFPPNATYTTYKPGTDMLYGQWLFESGADVQGVAVPRRDPETDRVAGGSSSAGVKWRGLLGQGGTIGVDLLLARDRRAGVLGVGVTGPLDGATWTAEAVSAHQAGNAPVTSLLVNTQYAWVWREKNVTGFLEYFHNGFGVSGSGRTLAGLPVSLAERLGNGELFTISSNYLAAGVDLQWTPLFDLKPSVISNLDDGSMLLIGQAVYSIGQNTDVTVGFQKGLGGHGTEYGGLETAPGTGIYASPAYQGYARLSWYF